MVGIVLMDGPCNAHTRLRGYATFILPVHPTLELMRFYTPRQDSHLGGSLDGFSTARAVRAMELAAATLAAATSAGGGGEGEEGEGLAVSRCCIVALTGGSGSDEEEEERCTAAGMDYFIPKPLRLRDLQMVLR